MFQNKNPILKDDVWEYTFLDDGSWIYKAVTKKPNFKEKPVFKISESIEDRYQDNFNKHIIEAIKNITKYLVR